MLSLLEILKRIYYDHLSMRNRGGRRSVTYCSTLVLFLQAVREYVRYENERDNLRSYRHPCLSDAYHSWVPHLTKFRSGIERATETHINAEAASGKSAAYLPDRTCQALSPPSGLAPSKPPPSKAFKGPSFNPSSRTPYLSPNWIAS